MHKENIKRSVVALAVTTALANIPAVAAQESEQEVEVIQVRGILGSLKRSMLEKKSAVNVSDGISAEDLGKFPDQNVAESLQRITGVSIDRSGGEGQFVSVRGFGPQFNSVLVNGRQIATENGGREFSFDTLAAEQISGADVYKSPTASMQEGGIGATINVRTARPFDFDGFKAVGSAKGVYDDLTEETAPQFSGLVTNTFMDNRLGVLLSVSHQERKAQNNIIESRFYRSGVTFEAQNGKQFNNAYVPQNFDLIVDEQDRERSSASAVIQYAPTDRLTLTLDGLVSKFEVDSDTNSLGHWFTDSNFIDAEVDANNSVVYIENSAQGATDFIRRSFGRDVDISAFGLNVKYDLTDAITMTADFSSSTAEENSGGDIFFNVMGYNNAYTWDNRSGDTPTITIAGGDASLVDAARTQAHYNERNGWNREDQIDEIRFDFEWDTGKDTFTKMRWGVYSQMREKDAQRLFVSDCNFYCGYSVGVPSDLLSTFTVDNFFSGLPNTWLTYDIDAYAAFRANEGLAILQERFPDRDIAAEYAALGYSNPQSQSDAFTVEEDIISAYMDFAFEGELGDMPWSLNAGFRYSKTDSTLSGVSRELLDLQPIPNDPSDLNEVYADGDNGSPVSAENSYTNILPAVNLKFDLSDDMLIRLAYSETLTRPTMDALNPAVSVTVSRPNNNQATGGNADLKPFLSSNWDVSYEWYYGDANLFVVAVFSKEVEDFIVSTVETETFNLASGSFDFDVRRPRNGEAATVNGAEIAWTHAWENGFGLQANATFVESDTSLDANSGESFALEGLGDSQNIVAFYEKDGIQLRLAFNNREGFLQNLVSTFGGTEPLNTESYGQWDISGSYDINENFTVFFEGVNITGEEVRRHGRFQSQFVRLEDNGSRWALGVRASF